MISCIDFLLVDIFFFVFCFYTMTLIVEELVIEVFFLSTNFWDTF